MRIAVLNLALAASCIGSAAPAEPFTVAALGDSLTQGFGLPADQGFVPQLQAWLQAEGTDAVVVNAGVSGDTTAGGLARIDWTLSEDVDALIVALGGNALLRGLPPEEARANLTAIMEKASAKRLPVLLIGIAAPGNYGPDYKAAFDAIFPDLAAEYGAILVTDFLAPIREAKANGSAPDDLMQADGLHPSSAGVALMVEAVGPKVRELVGKAGG